MKFFFFEPKEWALIVIGGPVIIFLYTQFPYPIKQWLPFYSLLPAWMYEWSLAEHLNFFAPIILIGAGFMLFVLFFYKVLWG